MPTVTATIPCDAPPAWAVLERQLMQIMNEAMQPFLDKYTHDDGTLIWRDEWSNSRDGADDFYESSYNWPLFYLLGGGDHALTLGQRQWDAITRQLTELGPVLNEYERGYDQFHQGESYIYFYFLCLADPSNRTNRERARRFAAFYTGDDPDVPNYDPQHKIIRAAHNGSGGPRWGTSDGDDPRYGWSAGMRQYGLPFADVPGVDHYDDLKDEENARRMGRTMQERMGKGDVAGNLIATSLVANAALMTGEARYRAWIEEYVGAWMERARQNEGLLPDNVGLSGQVGEYMGGKWYGGLYGWTWPHGYYNIGMAATVAGVNAFLLTGDETYLDLPRSQYDYIWKLGEMRRVGDLEMSLGHHWADRLGGPDAQAFVAPYRYGDRVNGDEPGWFDWQPLSPVYPVAIWNVSMAEKDWQRIENLRDVETYDWRTVNTFRNKEDGGHDQPWLRFLAGDNPDYPERILQVSYANVCRRLALIRTDEADITEVHIHHWQWHNPVVTEALVQLTLGAPQIIYNGGLLHCRVRYFDADRERPGLPEDVAALVEKVEAERTVLTLVNLSPFEQRTVIVQAGGFGEHRFRSATYAVRTGEYPGPAPDYAAPPLETEQRTDEVNDTHLHVVLPPATEITLDLDTERYVNAPSYAGPWG